MNLLNLFKKPHIGLDLKPGFARLVVVIKGRGRPYLRQTAEVRLPNDIFNKELISDWQLLRKVLHEGVAKLKLQSATVALALPNTIVKECRLTIPFGLSPQLIEKEIASQLRKRWGDIKEPFAIDYDFLDQEKQHLYCVAMPEAYLSNLIATVKACCLEIKVIETEAQALARNVTTWLSADKLPDYAIAAGLAMRDRPKW